MFLLPFRNLTRVSFALVWCGELKKAGQKGKNETQRACKYERLRFPFFLRIYNFIHIFESRFCISGTAISAKNCSHVVAIYFISLYFLSNSNFLPIFVLCEHFDTRIRPFMFTTLPTSLYFSSAERM